MLNDMKGVMRLLESHDTELELKGMHELLIAFRNILSDKLSHLKFTEDLNIEYENDTLYSRDKVKSVLLKEVSTANNLINEIENHINLFHDWDDEDWD
jgi:hypothetical protein